MNVLAACGGRGLAGAQGRLQVLGALLRLRARRPRLLHRGHGPPAPAADADRDATSSRPSAPSRRSPTATATSPSPCCASPTGSARTCDTSHTALLVAAGGPGDPRLRPALPVHPRGRHRRRAGARDPARAARASTTPPATACWCCRRSRRCSASRSRRCCRRGGPGSPRAALRRAGAEDPAGDAPAAALRPRASTTAGSRRPATRSAPRRARPCRRSPSTCACAACAPAHGEGYRYERDVEEFLRWSPAVRGERPARPGAAEPRSAGRAGARAGGLAAAGALGAARDGRRRRCAPARPPPRAVRPTPSWPPTRSG